MAAHLPAKPNLRHLQEQAKDLLKAHRRGELSACMVLRAHPRFKKGNDQSIITARVSLQEMQHALALHYALDSWRDLKASLQRRLTEETDHDTAEKVIGQLHETGSKGAQRIANLASKDDAGHIVYARLTGEKVGRSKPCEVWIPQEVPHDAR